MIGGVNGNPATGPRRTAEVLETLRRERAEAWRRHASSTPTADEETVAEAILGDPGSHEWRLVDAALERLRCADCGRELGAGPRGCARCDMADGFRFAAREPDRPSVPPGNEHAIRVSSAVLRMPHRYRGYVVRGNELFLPLFMAGQLPRREQKARLNQLLKRAPATASRLETAATFDELLALAEGIARRPAR